jgi:hypothetical protein
MKHLTERSAAWLGLLQIVGKTGNNGNKGKLKKGECLLIDNKFSYKVTWD